MKKRLSLAVILAAALLIGCSSYHLVTRDQGTVEYEIVAERINLEAVDSYPQDILGSEVTDLYTQASIRITLDNRRYKHVPLAPHEYPPEIGNYLSPSAKIESDSPAVQELADSIAPGEEDILKIAEAAVHWTAKNVRYDQELASRISNGEIDSQSAVETIDRRVGTCGECANVFIAIMRNKGIPARFVCGVVYGGGDHAWAEVYLHEIGWVPVEPQGGYLGVTNRHIKLFAGTDFAEIGVKLGDVRASIIRVE